MAFLDLGSLGFNLVLKKDGSWTKGFQDADNDIEQHQTRWGAMDGFLKKLGIATTVGGITASIGAMAKKGVDSALDLEKSMQKFSAQTGVTGKEADKVKDAITQLYTATGKSFDELRQLATNLHNDMGMSAEDIQKYATNFTKFAKVTEQDSQTVVANVAGIKNAWHLTNNDIKPLMDKLLVSQQKYGLSVQESEQSLKTLAPAFQALGMNIDQGISYLNLFHKAGLDSGAATIAFQTALRKVKSPEELKDIIAKMQQTKDDSERAKLGIDTFGKAGVQMAAALKPGSVSLNEIEKSLKDATGATDKAAGEMGKNFPAQIAKLKNMLNGLFLQIGQQVVPIIQKLVEYVIQYMPQIQGMIKKVFDTILPLFKGLGEIIKVLIDNQKIMIPVITGVVGAIAAYQIINTVKSLMKSWDESTIRHTLLEKGLNATLKANPIGVIVTLIGTAITVLKYLFDNNKAFHDFVVKSWQIIKDVVGGAIESVIGFFKNLGTNTTNLKNSIGETWDNIKQKTVEVWNGIVESIKGFITNIKDTIDAVFTSIKTFFVTVWEEIKNIFVSVVEAIISFVTDKFSWLIDGVKGILDGFKTFCEGLWDVIKNIFLGAILLIIDIVTGNFSKLKEDAAKILDNLKEAISQIWESIKQIFFSVIGLIVDFFKAEWNGLVTIGETIWNGFKDFMTGLWEGIKFVAESTWNGLKTTVINLCNNIKEGAVNIWNGLLDWFSELPGKLYTSAVNMFTSMKNGVTNTIYGVKDAVVTGINAAIEFITSLPSKAVEWGADFVQGIVDGITNSIHKVEDAVSALAAKIRSYLHFSVPDEGPLTEYETWMPDFMEGLAKGIEKNKHLVNNAVRALASDMKIGVTAGITVKKDNDTRDTEVIRNTGKSGRDINQYITINSPTALSPSETARQNRKVLQELALQI